MIFRGRNSKFFKSLYNSCKISRVHYTINDDTVYGRTMIKWGFILKDQGCYSTTDHIWIFLSIYQTQLYLLTDCRARRHPRHLQHKCCKAQVVLQVMHGLWGQDEQSVKTNAIQSLQGPIWSYTNQCIPYIYFYSMDFISNLHATTYENICQIFQIPH